MNRAQHWLKIKPLADANLPAWVNSIYADALREAVTEILTHKDQSACDTCNRFLVGVCESLEKKAKEVEK